MRALCLRCETHECWLRDWWRRRCCIPFKGSDLAQVPEQVAFSMASSQLQASMRILPLCLAPGGAHLLLVRAEPARPCKVAPSQIWLRASVAS